MICGSCGTPAGQPGATGFAFTEPKTYSAWELPEEAQHDNLTPDTTPLLSVPKANTGLGGRGVYIAVLLIAAPLLRLVLLGGEIRVLDSPRFQGWLSQYPGLDMYFFLQIVANCLFIALYLLLNYFFYRRKRDFMTLMVFQVGMQIVVAIGFFAWARSFTGHSEAQIIVGSIGLIRRVIGTALWVPCLLADSRYKQTFVN